MSRLLSSSKLFILVLAVLAAITTLPAYAQQVETSAICNEALEPLALNYGDKTEQCGFATGADVDSFTFVGNAGDEININLRTLTNNLDPVISLRDPAGDEVSTGSCVGRDTFNRPATCGFRISQTFKL